MSSTQRRHSTIRGLATVAMLKVNFDAGQDHINMFMPFVRDSIVYLPDNFVADDVRREVSSRHELTLPTQTLQTLLGRIVKEGYLQRQAGRYFRTEKALDEGDLRQRRSQIEDRQRKLADAFRQAVTVHGVEITSSEDALTLILDFMETYHIALTFDESPDPSSDDQQDHRNMIMTARFLRDTALTGGELAEILQEMLQGFVLQNVLLLKDIATAGRQFHDLHVFVDSRILFGALGLRGPAAKTATNELISLLLETGAILDVFEPTIQEMKRILSVYEDRIGTSSGRASLYPTDLTHHLVTTRATPSDIRMESSLLEHKLRQLAFNIREVPDRVPRWTLDERALNSALSSQPDDENLPRVVHDVDCIAGVLVYRRGTTSDSLDNAEAVFVTDSGLTVQNTKSWYDGEGGLGVPPIIHQISLANFAWLKKPASAAKLPLNELVALCVAAIRPTRRMWQRFVQQLKLLEESGSISSDEAAAIIASDLTKQMLVDEELTDDSDAASLSEAVERIKAAYKAEADAAIRDANTMAQRSAQEAEVKIREAESNALSREEEALRLQTHVANRARGIAAFLSWTLAALFALSFVIGVALSISDTSGAKKPSTLALILAIGPLATAGLFSVLWGFHLKAWQRLMEDRFAKWITHWMTTP